MIYLVFMCFMNLLISFMNARYCGLIWAESKAIGGYVRLLVWCGAIQSAIGFTSVYCVIAAFIGLKVGYFDQNDLMFFLNFAYVLIIVPAIGTGLVITLNSWMRLAYERSLSNLGIAGWNTFAQVRNMYRAYNAFGPALKSVGSAFSGRKKSRNAGTALIVIFVLMLGVITTTVIIRRYAGTLEIPESLKSRLPSEA